MLTQFVHDCFIFIHTDLYCVSIVYLPPAICPMRLLDYFLSSLFAPHQLQHKQMALKTPAAVQRTIIVIGVRSCHLLAILS